jgi:uncharacterized membrane protein
MSAPRDIVVDWAERGHIRAEDLPKALAIAGVTPDSRAWTRFLATFLLSLGALLIATGVIFFFAYNWDAIGRFGKFGLLEATFVAGAVAAWFYGPAKPAGQAALLAATLLTGALLALIGQTYQTGADTYQLFAWWAALIVPWVVVSRLPALWLIWIALLNLAIAMYFSAFPGLLGVVFSGEALLWVLFGVNGVASVIWELATRRGPQGPQGRWSARVLIGATGTMITILALAAILDRTNVEPLRLLVYVAWLGAMYACYRRISIDLFALAGSVLSTVIVVAALLVKLMLDSAEAGGFLFIGLVVIAMSAAGAWWLRRVAAEADR